MNQSDILFEEMPGKEGDLGIITLNRPEVLNALSHAMFNQLDQQLSLWQNASHIKAIIIQAAPGRAFCAGGDIRYVYQLGVAHDPALINFFGDEYRLNRRIYHYPKPYIALLDGMTMGGGAGISLHGSHRVATERLVFAMPETGIGFFPDVGATYFLSRLSGKMGHYLGLVGAKISSHDCAALGLIDHIVPQACFAELRLAIAETSLVQHSDAKITEILNQFSQPAEKSTLLEHQAAINTCFANNTMEDIVSALEHYPDAWCQDVCATLKTKSPTSLKVVLRQLQQGEKLHFDECMRLEYRMMSRFVMGHDLFEGIRAVIIDKDQSPHWKPAELREVSAAAVENYFQPLAVEL